MKVSIVTFHEAPSCGAMLQAWALQTVLRRMGHDPFFPAGNGIGTFRFRWPVRRGIREGRRLDLSGRWKTLLGNLMSIGVFRPAMAAYDAFRTAHLNESSVPLGSLADCCDAAVFGSDQIWNPALTLNLSDYFTGRGLPDGFRKVAYAASAGDSIPQGEEWTRLTEAVRRFNAVSVREPAIAGALGDALGYEPTVTLDPTLLLESADYLPLAAKAPVEGDYLYVYTLFYNSDVWNLARFAAARLGLKPVYTPLYQYTRRQIPRGVTLGVSPEQFLAYQKNAKCVLTDSFHGTALSLVFGKPVVALRHRPDTVESRPAAILRRVGCPHRLLHSPVSADEVVKLLAEPLSPDVSAKLGELRKDSIAWLAGSLSGTPTNHTAANGPTDGPHTLL